MPKEPMPKREYRASDKLYDAAMKRASERGETLSEAIRKFLERYTKGK